MAKAHGGSGRHVLTITQVNRYVKQLLDADALLFGLYIEGEISNYRPHASGHMYFTLKDQAASLNSVMFASSADNLAFNPKNGQKVIVFGRLSLYEKTGQYQLYIEHMEPAGIGGLQLAFQQLVEKLQKEGLFDDANKKAIPLHPACVAVITSPSGAAVQDIIRVAQERNPAIKLVIAPAQVQGQDASKDIARAIKDVNSWGKADVIILGRGGGSIEDLWAFNEEATARAIAASRIPVVSAVGHETDITVADFVADKRAPTPTAAAQMVAYDHAHAVAYLVGTYNGLSSAIKDDIARRHNNAKSLLSMLVKQATYRLEAEQNQLSHNIALLDKVSVYTVFKRGFALVSDEAGAVVNSVKSIDMGKTLIIQWADGKALVKVIDVTKQKINCEV